MAPAKSACNLCDRIVDGEPTHNDAVVRVAMVDVNGTLLDASWVCRACLFSKEGRAACAALDLSPGVLT